MKAQLQTTRRPIPATTTATKAITLTMTTESMTTTKTTTIPTTKKSRLLLLSSTTRKQQTQKQKNHQIQQHNNVTTSNHHEQQLDDVIRSNINNSMNNSLNRNGVPKIKLWNSSSSNHQQLKYTSRNQQKKDHPPRMLPKIETEVSATSTSLSCSATQQQQQQRQQNKQTQEQQQQNHELEQQPQLQQQEQPPQVEEESQTNRVIFQQPQQQNEEYWTHDNKPSNAAELSNLASSSNISLPRDWYYLSIKDIKRYMKQDPTLIQRPEEQSTTYYDTDDTDDDDNDDDDDKAASRTIIKSLLPLHIAIQESSSYTMIEYLYSLYPNAIKYSCSKYQWLPLHYAIANQIRYDIVEFLIQCYPDGMKQKDHYGNYPIHLLMDDYNPNNGYNFRRSSSSISANSISSSNSSNRSNSSSNSRCCNRNNNSNSFKVLKIMLKYDPDCIQYIGEDGNTILHRAIICGFSYRMMKYMIRYNNNNKMNNIMLQCYNNYHQLPIHCINEHPLLLHTSSSQYYIQLIQYVIDCYPESLCIIGGSSSNHINNINNDIVIGTPLHIAIRKGFSYRIIQKMIQTNPSILHIPDHDNHLPYYYMYQYCLLNDTYSLTKDNNEEINYNIYNSHSRQPNNAKIGHYHHSDDDDNCDALAVIKLMMESLYQQQDYDEEICPLYIMLLSSYNSVLLLHYSNNYWNSTFSKVIQYVMKQYPKLCSYQYNNNQLPLHILCQLVAITAKEEGNIKYRLCGPDQQQHLLYLFETIQLSLQLYPDSIKSYDNNGYLPFHTLLYGIDYDFDNEDNENDYDNDDYCSYVHSTVRSLLISLLDLYPLALEISPHTRRRNNINCLRSKTSTTTPSTTTIDLNDSSHIQMKRIIKRQHDSPIERLMYLSTRDHEFCYNTFIYILKKYPHILQIPCIHYNTDSINNNDHDDVSQEDSNKGMLPLHIAFQNQHNDIDKIRKIIALHYPNALIQIDYNGYTPFHYGCMNHILNQSYQRFDMNYYIQLCPNTVIHKTLLSSCYQVNSLSSTLSTTSSSDIGMDSNQLLGEENEQISDVATNAIIMMPQQSNKVLPLLLACENDACLDIIYGLIMHSMNELF